MKTNIKGNKCSRVFSAAFFALLICGLNMGGRAQTINTIAGNGSYGYTGDGGPATNAEFFAPAGVAGDQFGNVYVADFLNNVIRKIDVYGTITTAFGTGFGAGLAYGAYSGDGGQASAAELYTPTDIVFDPAGNCYISDYGNMVVRKIDMTTGIITTVAGSNYSGFSGDGGPATNAEIYFAWAIAVDGSGNLYIADSHNNVVRKVNSAGYISTVAGNYSLGAGYTGDGGQATAAQIDEPTGLVTDAAGNLYIAEHLNHIVRKVDPSGIISTFAGNGYGAGTSYGGYSGDGGAATNAEFDEPMGLTIDAIGNIYVADMNNSVVRKIDGSGIITTVAGNGTLGFTGDGGPATAAELVGPSDVSSDACGNLLIADYANMRVRRVQYGPVAPIPITGPTSVCIGATINLSDVGTGGTWTSGATTVASVPLSSGIVTGMSAGTAVITYTTPCFTSTYTVTVYPSPVLTGTAVICGTISATISTSVAGGTWSSSNTGVAVVGASGLYSATVSDGGTSGTATITYSLGGCIATITATVVNGGGITGPSKVCTGSTILLVDGAPGGVWSSGNSAIASVSATGIVTGNSMGSVMISYTDICGIDVHKVTVNPTPVITGTALICMGMPAVILSGGLSGGLWSSANTLIATVNTLGANGIVSGVAGGTTTLTYALAGCIATVTATVVPVAQACITQGIDPSCKCHVFTVTGTPGATVTVVFENCDGSVISSVSAPVGSMIAASGTVITYPPGTCIACVTNVSYMGCTWPANCCDNINHNRQSNPAGVQQVTNEKTAFLVVPNPSRGTINISGELQYDDNSGVARIEITDMLGRTVFADLASVDNGIINKTIILDASIANAVYLVKVHTDYTTEVVRFTLER